MKEKKKNYGLVVTLDLLAACKAMLATLDSLTTSEFARGMDREARYQMESAVDKAERVIKSIQEE